jgi:hypothetical protein
VHQPTARPRQLPRRRRPRQRFVAEALGVEGTEQIVLDDGSVAASWLHFGNKSYDLVYTNDWTGSTGRLHHIAFATDTRNGRRPNGPRGTPGGLKTIESFHTHGTHPVP